MIDTDKKFIVTIGRQFGSGGHNIAKKLAEKTLTLFGNDIKECGDLHEYYDPESGAPVNNKGFQNWNLFAIEMGKWLIDNNH